MTLPSMRTDSATSWNSLISPVICTSGLVTRPARIWNATSAPIDSWPEKIRVTPNQITATVISFSMPEEAVRATAEMRPTSIRRSIELAEL